jgi:hypothetical protein
MALEMALEAKELVVLGMAMALVALVLVAVAESKR